MKMGQTVFDAHCHVGRWGQHKVDSVSISPFPAGTEICSASDAQMFKRRGGLIGAVVVPTYSPDRAHTFSLNRTVLEIAASAPLPLVPGFWVDPSPCARPLLKDALRLAAKSDIFVLKISSDMWEGANTADPATWSDECSAGMASIADYARRRGCVVQIHTGGGKSDVRLVEKLVRWFGEGVSAHLVHMGGKTSGHFYFVPRFVSMLAEGLGVWCDTSLARGFGVRWIVEEARRSSQVAERILFASDEPWGIYAAELAKVLDSTASDTVLRESVLCQNALRLYVRDRKSRQ